MNHYGREAILCLIYSGAQRRSFTQTRLVKADGSKMVEGSLEKRLPKLSLKESRRVTKGGGKGRKGFQSSINIWERKGVDVKLKDIKTEEFKRKRIKIVRDEGWENWDHIKETKSSERKYLEAWKGK